jgi:hypothetical protein
MASGKGSFDFPQDDKREDSWLGLYVTGPMIG